MANAFSHAVVLNIRFFWFVAVINHANSYSVSGDQIFVYMVLCFKQNVE